MSKGVDLLIDSFNEQKSKLSEMKGYQVAFFDVLLECPNEVLPRYIIADYLQKELDRIYADDTMQWQVVGLENTITLAYGKRKWLPVKNIAHNEYINHSHADGYDFLSLNLPSMTFYEAKTAVLAIISQFNEAGL